MLPKTVGLVVATLSEWWGWLVGKEPTFTRFKVTYTCAIRYYNIEKARRLLGYEPQVGLEEGIKRTIDVRFIVSAGLWMYDNTDALSICNSGGRPWTESHSRTSWTSNERRLNDFCLFISSIHLTPFRPSHLYSSFTSVSSVTG